MKKKKKEQQETCNKERVVKVKTSVAVSKKEKKNSRTFSDYGSKEVRQRESQMWDREEQEKRRKRGALGANL